MRYGTFLSVDFETANANRVSACSLGVVKVVEGELVSERLYLINPVGEYSRMNTSIHGIGYEQTKDAPTFDVVFNELKSEFESFPIVVCYSSFDRSVFESLLSYYHLRLNKDVCFVDVYEMAKQLISGVPNYKLPTVAYHLNIPYATHHDAACDAAQCAKIFLKIQETATFIPNQNQDVVESYIKLVEDIIADGVVDKYEACQLQNFLSTVSGRGKIFKTVFEFVNEVLEDGVVEKRESDLLISVLKYSIEKVKDICIREEHIILTETEHTVEASQIRDFSVPEGFVPNLNAEIPGKFRDRWEYVRQHPFVSFASSNVVITEEGVKINRAKAEEIVVRLGGNLKSSTTRDVDFCVVLGMPIECCTTSKVTKARELQRQGSPIRVLSEDEFLDLVKSSLETNP